MKKRGFISRLIMGSDKKNAVPTNRFEVFKLVLMEYPLRLVKLSLIIFAAIIPLVVLIASKNVYLLYGNKEIVGNDYGIFLVNAFAYALAIPLVMFLTVCISGAFYVIRKIVWDESVALWDDFRLGIKKTFKESLVFGLILGLSLEAMTVNLYFLKMDLGFDVMTTTVVMTLSIVQFIIFLVMYMFALTQIVIYNQTLRSLFKNSLVFTVANLLRNLFWLLVAGFPVLLMLLSSNNLLTFIFYLGCGFFGFSYSLIVWTLYSHSVYDKYINAKHFRELVNKGFNRKFQ